jgi:hypothetical protein
MIDGGDEEDRTPDLRIANATLSQLSYVPIWFLFYPENQVTTTRFICFY